MNETLDRDSLMEIVPVRQSEREPATPEKDMPKVARQFFTGGFGLGY